MGWLLDLWNAVAVGTSIYMRLVLGLIVLLMVLTFIASVIRIFVWPALCAFGNWLGRP